MYTPLQPGTVLLGQYEIIQPIGAGGSGSIYLAHDVRTFNRRCVIKRLLAAHDPATRQRFAAEVQTITRLRHPNIAQVYAFWEDGPNAYMVMEYIAGHDLDHGLSYTSQAGVLMPGKPMDVKQALKDAITVCSILEHLHSRTPAVVHCDIKPANLIRDTESASLFLVDFGAATTASGADSYGTPGYAAPEMYRGQRLPASDIYALAATIYHLITDDDPSLHPLHFPQLQRIPGAIRSSIEKALQEDSTRRPTATQLRLELEQCLLLPLNTAVLNAPNGSPIHTSAELVAVIQSNWTWAQAKLTDGTIQAWLQAANLYNHIKWLDQARLTERPEHLLSQLIQRLDPHGNPIAVRVGQKTIDIEPGTYTSLWLAAERGVARVWIESRPHWLACAPSELNLYPEQPESFRLMLDEHHAQQRLSSGTLVLRADTGQKKPQRIIVNIQPVQSSQQSNTNTPNAAIKLNLVLLGSIALIAILGIAVLIPEPAVALRHASILLTSLFMGSLCGVFQGPTTSEEFLISGLGFVGGIGGGYIAPLLVIDLQGVFLAQLLCALVGAIVGSLFFQLIK